MINNLNNLVYVLKNSGYAIIEDFVGSKTLKSLKKKAFLYEKEIDNYKKKGGQLSYLAGHPLKNARAIYCYDKIFQDLIMKKDIYRVAKSYLGNAELRDVHLLVNSPDKANKKRGVSGKVNWHRDSKWLNRKISPFLLHSFLLLSDMTKNNGGTFVVPGSHREKEPHYYFLENIKGEQVKGNYYKVYPQNLFPSYIQLKAKKGSLIFLDPMLIHSPGINITNSRRSLINFSFHKKGVKPLMDCKSISKKNAKYKLSESFFSILSSGNGIPNEYGPQRRC